MKRSKLAKYHKLSLCISIFIIAVVVFSGCTKSGSNANPKVHVAGFETENGKVCAWVDGEKTTVPNISGKVESLFIINGKVYATGSLNKSLCYWVDGVKTELPLTDMMVMSAEVSYLTKVDGDVHVYGTAVISLPASEPYTILRKWINGTKADIDLTADIGASDILGAKYTLVNGRIYASLMLYAKGADENTAATAVGAKLTELSGKNPVPSSIAVSGQNIYVAGRYKKAGLNKACYWVDGKQVELPGGTASRATSIAVEGSNIYVSGYYYDGINKACYWINGVKTDLDGGAVSGAVAETDKLPIALANGKVYIAGNIFLNNNKKACYWVDGARVDLSGGVKAVAIEVY